MSDGSQTSEFGDFEEADAFDTDQPDPEQVAIKISRLRRDHGLDVDDWEELSETQRQVRIQIAERLIAWLRRQGGI
jgi:type II secretory pathway component PulM